MWLFIVKMNPTVFSQTCINVHWNFMLPLRRKLLRLEEKKKSMFLHSFTIYLFPQKIIFEILLCARDWEIKSQQKPFLSFFLRLEQIAESSYHGYPGCDVGKAQAPLSKEPSKCICQNRNIFIFMRKKIEVFLWGKWILVFFNGHIQLFLF